MGLAACLPFSMGDDFTPTPSSWIESHYPTALTVEISQSGTASLAWVSIGSETKGDVAIWERGPGRFDVFTTACEKVGYLAWTDDANAGLLIEATGDLQGMPVPRLTRVILVQAWLHAP